MVQKSGRLAEKKIYGYKVAFTHSCGEIGAIEQAEPPLVSSMFNCLIELSLTLLLSEGSVASDTISIISGERTLFQNHFRNQQRKKCALMLLEQTGNRELYLLLHWCEPSRISILVFSFRFIPFGTQVQNIVCFTNGKHQFTRDSTALQGSSEIQRTFFNYH